MDSYKRAAIKEIITKAVASRSECSMNLCFIIDISIDICYSNDADTKMAIPDCCYHRFCVECVNNTPTRYTLIN